MSAKITYLEGTEFQKSRAYSPAVITEGGKTIWLAGQTATTDESGKDISYDFDAQAHACFALMDKNTPLWVFQACAFLSGIGGGNFSASMSNINTFFPKKQQGLALGLNAGLGNFGVTTMQVLIPLVMTVGLFGAMAGGSMVLSKDSGWILGKIVAGTPTWIQNAGFIWAAVLVPLVIAAWFGMNNLLTVTPNHGGTLAAFGKILYLYGLAFAVGALGLYLYLRHRPGWGYSTCGLPCR